MTSVWGPGVWISLHIMSCWASEGDDNVRNYFYSWIRYLSHKLPCEQCSKHMQAYVKANPPENVDPFYWVWKFHNSVNKRLGKQELDYDTVRKYYYKDSSDPIIPQVNTHLPGTNTVCEFCDKSGAGNNTTNKDPNNNNSTLNNRFIPSKYYM